MTDCKMADCNFGSCARISPPRQTACRRCRSPSPPRRRAKRFLKSTTGTSATTSRSGCAACGVGGRSITRAQPARIVSMALKSCRNRSNSCNATMMSTPAPAFSGETTNWAMRSLVSSKRPVESRRMLATAASSLASDRSSLAASRAWLASRSRSGTTQHPPCYQHVARAAPGL